MSLKKAWSFTLCQPPALAGWAPIAAEVIALVPFSIAPAVFVEEVEAAIRGDDDDDGDGDDDPSAAAPDGLVEEEGEEDEDGGLQPRRESTSGLSRSRIIDLAIGPIERE